MGANLATGDSVHYNHIDGFEASGFVRGIEWCFVGGVNFVRLLMLCRSKVELQKLGKGLCKPGG